MDVLSTNCLQDGISQITPSPFMKALLSGVVWNLWAFISSSYLLHYLGFIWGLFLISVCEIFNFSSSCSFKKFCSAFGKQADDARPYRNLSAAPCYLLQKDASVNAVFPSASIDLFLFRATDWHPLFTLWAQHCSETFQHLVTLLQPDTAV